MDKEYNIRPRSHRIDEKYNINPQYHQSAKEYTTFVSPDSLRQFLSLQKKFYDLHTKKNMGYTDIKGVKYSGIVENYGLEQLFESRKLLLNKPPITNLIFGNDFSYHFDFQYADCIDTYNLQSLISATLKEDVFLSNKEYRIRFDDFEIPHKTVLRSESTSDPDVHRFVMISTKTAPTLIITENGVDIEIPLTVQDDCYSIAQAFLLFKKEYKKFPSEKMDDYYRRFNSMLPIFLPKTKADITFYFYIEDGIWNKNVRWVPEMITDEVTGRVRTVEHMVVDYLLGSCNDDIIDSIDNETKTLITKPITNKWKNRSLIWLNSTTHQTLPDLEMVNNDDAVGLNILEVGTDGHHKTHLYPLAYGIENIPGLTHDNINDWYIKVIPEYDRFVDDIDHPENYDVTIKKIMLIHSPTIGHLPLDEREIQFNGDFKHITLATGIPWRFRTAVPGDYDYKEPTEEHGNIHDNCFDSSVCDKFTDRDHWAIIQWKNVMYAYIPLSKFIYNDPQYNGPIVEEEIIVEIPRQHKEDCEYYKHDPDCQCHCHDHDFDECDCFEEEVDDDDCTFEDDIKPKNDRRIALKAAFVITFDHKFLYDTEILSGAARSGLHSGISSDYSDNGLIHKNGVIHHLGEFDGLPEYFKMLLPRKTTSKTPDVPFFDGLYDDEGTPLERSIYRAHVEAYTIRDVATDEDQTVFEKQIAALLVDAGIPQHQLPDFLNDLTMTIVYEPNHINERMLRDYRISEGIFLGHRTNPLYGFSIVDNGAGYNVGDEFEFRIGKVHIHGRVRRIVDVIPGDNEDIIDCPHEGDDHCDCGNHDNRPCCICRGDDTYDDYGDDDDEKDWDEGIEFVNKTSTSDKRITYDLIFILDEGFVETEYFHDRVTTWDTMSKFQIRCPVCRDGPLGAGKIDTDGINRTREKYNLPWSNREPHYLPIDDEIRDICEECFFDREVMIWKCNNSDCTTPTHCDRCGAAYMRSRGEGLKLRFTIHPYLWDLLHGNLEAIKDMWSGNLYHTVAKSESHNNWKSEITWMGYTKQSELFPSVPNIGNSRIPGQEGLQKFYFHYHRTFSLNPYGHLEHRLEAARVFNISNDAARYINNDLATYLEKKPPRTMARIIDIPTSWMQMIGVKKFFPPTILDIYYVRQWAAYTPELQEIVWNTLNRRWVWRVDENNNLKVPRIFNHYDDLDEILPTELLQKFYLKRINLNMSIDLMDKENILFDVYDEGSMYEENDIFRFFIGGNTISGIVKEIGIDGTVSKIEISRSKIMINIANIYQTTVFETTHSTGVGKGLTVLMTVNEFKWNNVQPRDFGVQDGLFTFLMDRRNNMWIWEYNRLTNKWFPSLRITGEDELNEYDDDENYMLRTVRTTFLYNTLSSKNDLSRIGDQSLQLQGLHTKWAFTEYGFDRRAAFNENIHYQYRDNVLVSNISSNPKHYTINIQNINPNTNWWNSFQPTSRPNVNTQVWSFNFKIEDIEFIYTFTNTIGEVNTQTTDIKVNTPFPNTVRKDLFNKSNTIVVPSRRVDNDRFGPMIEITLSDDYYIWLFAAMGCFSLSEIERASFEVLDPIDEPSTFRFTIRSPNTQIEYRILVKYILDDNEQLIGPIYILGMSNGITDIMFNELSSNNYRGQVMDKIILFDAIKNNTVHVYNTTQICDVWNEFEPEDGWVVDGGPRVQLTIDEHHYDRIIPQVRYTNVSGLMESTVTTCSESVEGRIDHSDAIKGMNRQQSLYFLINNNRQDDEEDDELEEAEEVGIKYHDIIEFEFFNYSNTNTWYWMDPGHIILPQFHQLNLPEYYNRTNQLVYTTFNPHDNDEPYSKNVQPLMSIFNPIKDTLRYLQRIDPDLTYITGSDEITFANTIDRHNGILNMDIDDLRYCGSILQNCYSYNENSEVSDMITLRRLLTSMNRGNVITPLEQICPETDEYAYTCMCEHCIELSKTYGYDTEGLVGYILKEFGDQAHPIKSEGTKYAYSKQMLIDYIMQNSTPTPSYKKDGISLFRKRCETVIGYNQLTRKWQGIGPQPIGGYDTINIREHNPDVTVRSRDHKLIEYYAADIAYVFHMEKFPDVSTLQTFRMYANDFDISANTLMIFRDRAWVWWDGMWRDIYFESDFDPDVEKDCSEELFN